tara:strand:- start:63743 stop:65008 length:1266 start_codon:yes stop_codon:yes gene_type:complete
MSRAHLVIDQLRNLVGQSRGNEILVLSCETNAGDVSRSADQAGAVSGAVSDAISAASDPMGTHPVNPGSASTSDTAIPTRQAAVVVHHEPKTDFATMLLLGWSAGDVSPVGDVNLNEEGNGKPRTDVPDANLQEMDLIALATKALSGVLDPLLHERGVCFLQFATDVCSGRDRASQDAVSKDAVSGDAAPASDRHDALDTAWQTGMGLSHIGNLEYLSGAVGEADKSIDVLLRSSGKRDQPALEFRQAESIAQLAQVVDRTYLQTMDCPLMSRFRGATQTLGVYHQSDAYAPELWFSIHSGHRNSDDPSGRGDSDVGPAIGCLLMGKHVSGNPPSDNGAAPDGGDVISELVYMGLVPEVRGAGLGRQIIKQATSLSKSIGAQRMILAVDEANRPARDLYRSVGLQPMMRESVWGKNVAKDV